MIRFFSILALFLAGTADAEGTISAAGRIESLDKPASCSAALIRPDVIVTAAHCGQRGKWVFRPGDGQDGDVYQILKVTQHPLYDRDGPRVDWKLRFDIAVGRLAKPVPASRAVPFSLGDDAVLGERLFIVSWRLDATGRPRQRICLVFDGVPRLVTLACRVQGGESGAPVLRRTEDGLELVAIVSSRARVRGQPVAQASNVRLRLPPLLDIVDADTP